MLYRVQKRTVSPYRLRWPRACTRTPNSTTTTTSTAHADTQTHQALRHASCDAAGCCVIAQHTQESAIAAANSIANHQVEAHQAISCASTVLPFAAAAAQTQQIAWLHALMQHRKPHVISVQQLRPMAPRRPQAAPCHSMPRHHCTRSCCRAP